MLRFTQASVYLLVKGGIMDYEKLYRERKDRIETAVAGGEPDRVPNVAMAGFYPIHKAGLTMAESMVDHEAACKAMYDFYALPASQASFDTAAASNFMPAAKALEAIKPKTARWPGDPKGLDVNNTYQFIEFETMHEDEYDEFFDDPAGFWLRKHLPRTFEIFEPLEHVDFYDLMGGESQNFLLSPDKIPVYQALLDAATENAKMFSTIGKYTQMLRELGYYDIMGGGSATAFDMVGDTLRCTFGMMPDMIVQRENVKRAIDIFSDCHIRRTIGFCKATGSKYGWVMLHKGFDNFISDEDYAELYWPSLQKWILALIDAGITPFVYTEGAYNTRLKYLRDVPEHKVVYHFEDIDFARAKKELGDVACLEGGFPNRIVQYGTPTDIREALKRHLDIVAPGGGYLFNLQYSLDDCPPENMKAVEDALVEFGTY